MAIAWFLVTTICMLTWTVLSIVYLVVVVPAWQENKDSCDYLVFVVTLVLVGYHGVVTGVYLTVIAVVIVFDCNRSYNMKDIY